MAAADGPGTGPPHSPRAGHARPGHGRPAAFFDLDKTIIAKSSTLAFSRSFYAGGLISRGSVLRSAYAQFVYLVGGADHDQMEKMREFLSELFAGWDVQTVRDIVADTLHHIVDPLVYDEAVSLIEEHQLAGRDVVIVSASGAEVVEPIGEMLGADGVVATRMEIEDGKYTGEVGYYAYAENKAIAIEGLAQEKGYDLSSSYAYSDSMTDVHMLEMVGPPLRRQPRQGAAAERHHPGLAGAGVQPSGGAAPPDAAAAEQAHPGRDRGRDRGGGGGRDVPRRAPTRRAGRLLGPPEGPAHPALDQGRRTLSRPGSPGVQKEPTTQDPHVNQVPTRRTTLPIGRCLTGSPGATFTGARLVATDSRVSGGTQANELGAARMPLRGSARRAGWPRRPAA